MKLVFSTKKKWNFISWAIKLVMGTSYSHVGLCYTLFGQDIVVEATGLHGVRIISKEKFHKENKIIVAMDVNSSKAKKAFTYCLGEMGDGYSWGALFGILLKKDKIGDDKEHKFQCSELMARAFGIKDKNLDHMDVKEFKDLVKDYL